MSHVPDHAPHGPSHAPRVMEDEPPPILGSWRRIYIVVICYLACLIFAFYIFARVVRP